MTTTHPDRVLDTVERWFIYWHAPETTSDPCPNTGMTWISYHPSQHGLHQRTSLGFCAVCSHEPRYIGETFERPTSSMVITYRGLSFDEPQRISLENAIWITPDEAGL